MQKLSSSLLRSKSDSPSPRKGRTFSRILSSGRSPKPDSSPSGHPPPPLPKQSEPDASPNPHTSPTSKSIPQRNDSLNEALSPEDPSSPEDSTQEWAHTNYGGNEDSHVFSSGSEDEEKEINRHLMDIESSFLPDHVQSRDVPSSDTGFESAKSPRSYASISWNSGLGYISNPNYNRFSRSQTSSQSASTIDDHRPAGTRPTARNPQFARISEEDEVDYGESSFTQSSIRHTLSSPSAAAAQRSKLRAAHLDIPITSDSDSSTANDVSWYEEKDPLSSEDVGRPVAGSNDSKTVQASNDRAPPTHLSDDAHDDEEKENQSHHSQERDTQSKNTEIQQRHSESSLESDDAGSNSAPFNEDNDGATPGSMSTAKPGNELSRLPSLGSVASSMSGHTEMGSNRRRRGVTSGGGQQSRESNLESLAEEEKEKLRSAPDTPQAGVKPPMDPTNTVVAQHVRNVEVPTAIAQRFRDSYMGEGNAQESNNSTPFFGGKMNNLPLKEQNSRIDKLSKENFDLKLKIHFLYQALQDRSDEGIKDIVSKNAQLQADLVKSKKENQSLRKQLRDAEREPRAREDATSTTRTNVEESEDGVSSRDFRQAQMEEEIIYLRDRIQVLEDENARLNVTKSDPAEMQRRERIEQKNRDLIAEVERLKHDRSPFRMLRLRRSENTMQAKRRPASKPSDTPQESQEARSLAGTTAVEELKQEVSDLRRDLGAQTSMLTSRNRERERLQQEIEDLKLLHRRGDMPQSATSDGLFDSSLSRSHLRPTSRQSNSTRATQLSDADRDQYEAKQAALRDENAALRMRNQDLQRDLNSLTDSAEHLESLRAERDDALRLMGDERDLAADTIDQLEEMIEEKEKDISQLLSDLRSREDETGALHHEIKSISESLTRVADDWEASQSTIQNLQQDLTTANGEIEAMEQKMKDNNAAKERLEVQAESSQSEISFLRDEQEGDKLKISDLQAALNRAKTNLRDEKERLQEMEELEADAQKARDEARALRKSLKSKDEDVASYRESFDELDQGLRQALNDWASNSVTLLKQVARLKRDLESSSSELDQTRQSLNEKSRHVKDRDILLKTHKDEAKRLKELVERERQARRNHQNELERTRKFTDDDDRLAEMENAWTQDREQSAALEERYILHLRERNQLLFDLWARLSNLCGSDWLEKFCKEQDCDPPTVDSASADLQTFEHTIQAALDSIDQTINTFRMRIRSTEKDIYKDFEALEYELKTRTKRIDRLEKTVAKGAAHLNGASLPAAAGASISGTDASRLKDENKLLRRELKILKQGAFALPGLQAPHEDLERAAAAAATVERQREKSRPASLKSYKSHHTSGRERRSEQRERERELVALQQQQQQQQRKTKRQDGADERGVINAGVDDAEAEVGADESTALEPYRPRQNYQQHRYEPDVNLSISSMQNGTHRQWTYSRQTTGLGSVNHRGHSNSIGTTIPGITGSHSHSNSLEASNFTNPATASGQWWMANQAQAQAQAGEYDDSHPTLAPSEQLWILRLKELQRRLRSERHGRLVDRDGARQRLREEGEGKEEMKRELERERWRGYELEYPEGYVDDEVNEAGDGDEGSMVPERKRIEGSEQPRQLSLLEAVKSMEPEPTRGGGQEEQGQGEGDTSMLSLVEGSNEGGGGGGKHSVGVPAVAEAGMGK
ncbi:MAG: Anucleate primary sterigmata protein B [Alyxoria varia]|nr:MAG: Anucleate primary sterigmata protein B [Alyxoria varia]